VEEIVTGEAVVLDLPCARFPTRLLAHMIDRLLQVAMLLAVTYVAGLALSGHSLNTASLAAVLVTAIAAVVVGYPVTMETLSRGRTVGKMALGLQVVSDDGGPVRFRQALVRGLAGAVECWALLGVPALFTSMVSARGKRLGDVFAGTFVMRVRAPRAATGAFTQIDPALRPWAASLDLSGLPDSLAASASSYLSRYGQLDARMRDHLGGQLAAGVAARVSPPPPPGVPPAVFLHTVLGERRNRDLARMAAIATRPAYPPYGYQQPVPQPPYQPPPPQAPFQQRTPPPPHLSQTRPQPSYQPQTPDEPPPATSFVPPS
jgi:uncharacterized RDD family membrane protein YckC